MATDSVKWTDVVSAISSGTSALLAIVAAVVAVFAVRAALRANETQNKQLRRLEATQEQELASKFVVWIRRSSPDAPPWFQVVYANTSGLPFQDVVVQLSHAGKSVAVVRLSELEPTDHPTPLDGVGQRFAEAILEAESGKVDHPNSEEVQAIQLPALETGYAVRVSPRYKIDLVFEDSNGNIWTRRHGELIPVGNQLEGAAFLLDGSTGRKRTAVDGPAQHA